MRILHLADLHLGKTLHNASLIDNGDQRYWIEQILALTDQEQPDAVVIAGDVYDRAIPPKEAVGLLSELLTQTAKVRKIPVLLIAGNHDSPERLEFAAELLQDSRIYIAGSVEKQLQCVTLTDAEGPVNFWLMPYVFPIKVRDVYGLTPEEIPDYDAAVRKVLQEQKIDPACRNVLVAHQYVTGSGVSPIPSDSETVGSLGAVDVNAFDAFDYVALGHIHRSQSIGRETVRYAGAPLCYHFSEVEQPKGAMMVTLGAKGTEPECRLIPIPVLHAMRCISGKFADLIEQERKNPARNEYVAVVLTDRDPVRGAADELRALFESHGTRMLDISFRPEGRENLYAVSAAGDISEKRMDELFAEFYADRRGEPMEERDEDLIRHLSDRILSRSEETEEELTDWLIRFAMEQEV